MQKHLLVVASAFLSLWQTLPPARAGQGLYAGFVSPLTKILREPGADGSAPGSVRLPVLRPTYHVTAARNEFESLQLLMVNGDEPLEEVTVSCREAGSSRGDNASHLTAELFWEHYVFVYKPSGNALDDPMWYPDALIPLTVQPARRMEAHQTEVVWITVYVPPNTRPGSYSVGLRISSRANRSVATLTFGVTVEDFTLPEERHFHATGALYYEMVRDYYNKHYRKGAEPFQPDSPEWLKVKKIYYEYLLRYRFIGYDLPVEPDAPEAAKYLEDPRVNCFRLPWIDNNDQRFRSLARQLKQHGYLGRAYSYQADEPTVAVYPDVIRLATRLHHADPSLRHLVTIGPSLPLYQYVDIWCPNIGDAINLGRMDFDRLQRRRRLGEETWWYTMTIPRYPYPTWLVDDDAVAPRLFFWMSSLYGFNGCVYSMVHGWSEDPYRKVESFLDSNGDGLLIYPGEPFGSREPFPSIRLMMIRDGLEDYEMLRALPSTLRDRACRALIQDLTRFDRSPERLEQVRKMIFEALTRKKKTLHLPTYHQPEWPSRNTTCTIPRTVKAPAIDGVLNEGEWMQARSLAGFVRANGLKQSKAITRAWLCFDNENLYIAANCEIPVVATQDPLARQWFALSIDPGRKLNRYYTFLVTAKGNSHTELRSSEGMDPNWKTSWTFKSRANGNRFFVEMAIPFSSLKWTPRTEEVWGFNLQRRCREELSAWQANFGDVSLMPRLRFDQRGAGW